MEQFHGTTIVSVRRGTSVALGGDGQVTLGNIVIKGTARKVRKLYNGRLECGFYQFLKSPPRRRERQP